MVCSVLKACLAVCLLLLPQVLHAQFSDVNFEVAKINKCVYEVIVPKPVEDTLTYEKPLPMDLIPFQVRNDAYYSIGTAFACSPTEFITAGHVMDIDIHSHFKGLFIRDVNGNVFAIDKIIKFSSRRDFVVFTVKDRQSADYLEFNLNPEIGEKVFAVGNALGQGLVIRDGLYTSNTPEEIDGKWKWIRFSAAASPGNSGGPLLDRNGKVIGIVVAKSESENLNSALPITEVANGSGDTAELFHKLVGDLEIFDYTKVGTLDARISLPKPYAEFREAAWKVFIEFLSGLRKDLLAENRSNTFPNGSGFTKVLYMNPVSGAFPKLIQMGKVNWEPSQPSKIVKVDLENNGKVSHGVLKNTTYARIEKPGNISLKDFYTDSRLFSEIMLKGITLYRSVGPEKIRVTSLGKADRETVHTDAYGRKWLIKTWPLQWNDREVAVFILPVPDGCVIMAKMEPTGVLLDYYVEEMKLMADFVSAAYAGTLKQWAEFLQMTDTLPSFLSECKITTDSGSFTFESGRFKAKCQTGKITIDENSWLVLNPGFCGRPDSVTMDIGRLVLLQGEYDEDGFKVERKIKPVDEDEKHCDLWQKLTSEKSPYDRKILIKDNTTTISTVRGKPGKSSNGDCGVLYSVSHMRSGVVDQVEMESELARFANEVIVLED